MEGEQFSLVWNSFPTNLSSGLYTLLTDEHLVDVTLTAEGKILRAHKLILSVCSSYFRELFEGNTCKHPIVILKDVNYRDLSAMLHFMYQGEVNIKQEDISSFLKLAETLQIKGLTTEKTRASSSCDENKKDEDSVKTEMCEYSEERNMEEAESQRLQDSFDSAHQEKSQLMTTKESCVKITSGEALQQSEVDSHRENVMHSINRIFHKNYDDQPNEMETLNQEPLDYTSEVRSQMNTTEEPLNYRLDMNNPSPQDFVPSLSCGQDCEREILGKPSRKISLDWKIFFLPLKKPKVLPSFSLFCENQRNIVYININTLGIENQPKESKDLNCEGASSYSRGKKTVRGLPGGSLPLETTLRVVSEIGPTLRVDRGKVVRMYSCPWCLRHFTRKENLKLHVRYIHGPLESLTCKLCGNKYKNSNSLRVHSYLYHNTRRSKHAKPQILGGNG